MKKCNRYWHFLQYFLFLGEDDEKKEGEEDKGEPETEEKPETKPETEEETKKEESKSFLDSLRSVASQVPSIFKGKDLFLKNLWSGYCTQKTWRIPLNAGLDYHFNGMRHIVVSEIST